MEVTDYYRILQVEPTATLQEIKRAYRKLAHIYHPDKNGGNQNTAAYFREITEAYQVLSDPTQRENYNYLRWQHRNSGKKYDTPPYSAETILSACVSLRNYVSDIDIFRMDQDALYYQLCKLLSQRNLTILQEQSNSDMNRQILEELIQSARLLHFRYIEPLGELMTSLAQKDTRSLSIIRKFVEENRRSDQWERNKILIILVTTLVLSLLIYFMGK